MNFSIFVSFVLSSLIIATEATPQLADFDDLFALATGKITNDEMRERDDRSLANSYPFNLNHVAQEVQHQSHIQTGPQQAYNQVTNPQVAYNQATNPQLAYNQQTNPQVAYNQQTKPQVAYNQQTIPQVAYNQITNPSLTTNNNFAPASVFSYNQQDQSAAGFNLLAGFGSRLSPQLQYQIGGIQQQQQPPVFAQPLSSLHTSVQASLASKHATSHAEHHQSTGYAQPAQLQGYQQDIGLTQNNVFIPDLLPDNGQQCPIVPGLPISKCVGAVSSCWSIGVPDLDCPGNNLCCFDGCANSCLGQRRIIKKKIPVTIPTRPVDPKQKRKEGGQTLERVAAAGKKCIDKVEQVEEIEYDEVEQCDHTYDKKCHTSYTTEYESQQEEECDDNYKKSCQITYSPHAENVTVQICMTPLVKDCNLSGPEICRTEYTSECWTKNDEHVVEEDVPRCRTEHVEKCVESQVGYVTETDCKKWPKEVCTISKEYKKKLNRITKCDKVPIELCGPAGCGFTQGPEQCHDQVKTVITDLPNEECDLQPQRKCSHVTKLVPKLTPVEECVDVPKEVCQKSKGNPRTVIKAVTKKWCYTPSLESGLA